MEKDIKYKTEHEDFSGRSDCSDIEINKNTCLQSEFLYIYIINYLRGEEII